MTDWNKSIVIIVPEHLRDKANRLSCALGHDVLPGNTFVVPLTDGENTFYGCQTAAKQEFLDILTAAGEGRLPPDLDLAAFDLTPADVTEVMTALTDEERPLIDVRDDDHLHFTEALAARGLSRVTQ